MAVARLAQVSLAGMSTATTKERKQRVPQILHEQSLTYLGVAFMTSWAFAQ